MRKIVAGFFYGVAFVAVCLAICSLSFKQAGAFLGIAFLGGLLGMVFDETFDVKGR